MLEKIQSTVTERGIYWLVLIILSTETALNTFYDGISAEVRSGWRITNLRSLLSGDYLLFMANAYVCVMTLYASHVCIMGVIKFLWLTAERARAVSLFSRLSSRCFYQRIGYCYTNKKHLVWS